MQSHELPQVELGLKFPWVHVAVQALSPHTMVPSRHTWLPPWQTRLHAPVDEHATLTLSQAPLWLQVTMHAKSSAQLTVVLSQTPLPLQDTSQSNPVGQLITLL